MTKLEQLELKKTEIQKEISEIISVRVKKREKEMELLVGCCIKGECSEYAFRKILDFVINKEYGIYFIFEEVKINEQGEPSISVTSEYPYVNKEWNDKKIPLYGWTKEITEQEYIKKKAKVLKEISNPIKLRKFLMDRN